MNYSTSNRDNNFNLIRFFAATFVLYNHSFILAGFPFEEPLWKRYTSMVTFGPLGVDIFFSTSGFLLGLSLIAKNDLISFAINRFLRIFPGLLAAVTAMIAITGLFFSTHHGLDFFLHQQTIDFFKYNTTLLKGVQYILPGAFSQNPEQSINGSLWTLPNEIYAYGLLIVIAAASQIFKKNNQLFFNSFIILAFLYFTYLFANSYYSNQHHLETIRLFFFFFYGVLLAIIIPHLELDLRCAMIFTIAIIASLSQKKFFFKLLTIITIYHSHGGLQGKR